LLCAACAATTVFAQSEPNPDELTATPNRPTVTDIAETTQRGVLELEFGIAATHREQALVGLLKFGLLRDLELRWAGSPWQHDSALRTGGVTDTDLGLRWRLLHQARVQPTVSLQYTATLPTAGALLGSGESDHGLGVLVSKDLPAQFHLDANLTRLWLGRPRAGAARGGFDQAWLPAFTLAHPIRGKWALAMEFSGVTRAGPTGPLVQNLWAVTYTPKPRLVIDAAVQYRVIGNVPNVVYVAGFTWAIADLYRGRRR